MAFTFSKSLTLFLVLNLLFFSLVSACGDCGSGSQYPKPTPKPQPKPHPKPPQPKPSPSGGGYPGLIPSIGSCPVDTLKLGVCANVLNGLVNVVLGKPPKEPCCPLIKGLIDAEAAVCLCTAIKANILGIHLNVPVNLSLLVNYCGCELPRGFQCA